MPHERKPGPTRGSPPPYLVEHHDTVMDALRHDGDLLFRDDLRWETTVWTRSRADAATLKSLLEASVKKAIEPRADRVSALVEVLRGLPAEREDEPAPAQATRWGVRIALRRNPAGR